MQEVEKDNPATPLAGVASYSKVFSIAKPELFAIYDARVAACLNAIQCNAQVKKGTAINYVPGRNNVVGHVEKKCGFAQMPEFSVRTLVKGGWMRIRRDVTYTFYLDVLARCLKDLGENTLLQLEMALFSDAETQCLQAMNDVKLKTGSR